MSKNENLNTTFILAQKTQQIKAVKTVSFTRNIKRTAAVCGSPFCLQQRFPQSGLGTTVPLVRLMVKAAKTVSSGVSL